MKTFLVLLFCLLNVVMPKASAFEVTLTEQQVSDMLQIRFPVRQSYQGFDITFSDPKVNIEGAINNIKVKSVILAQQNGQKLRAIASVQGQINYNQKEQVIEIIKPSLVEFTILDNSIAQSEQTINTLKQAIGQQLPMIFLLDMKQIGQLLPGLQPKNIALRGSNIVINF
ncbi:hypothetical protein [Paraglaciecola hydrolytica]|uniref:DUF1439 domain-containing protein n=1 Tax=Paraglaciecola hydrolytica TaxID=1799789 RepID=A0A136A532_9ALTE|nr:hypothetical protein [Paraglaciecola hydrolytica]KXI30329.1 hypothetical protein AX660_10150 [Paraglaciecola hydrolytica]